MNELLVISFGGEVAIDKELYGSILGNAYTN